MKKNGAKQAKTSFRDFYCLSLSRQSDFLAGQARLKTAFSEVQFLGDLYRSSKAILCCYFLLLPPGQKKVGTPIKSDLRVKWVGVV